MHDVPIAVTVAVCALVVTLPFQAYPQAQVEVVEEVLAAVGRTPILRSDIDLAVLVRLAEPEPQEGEEQYRSRLLDLRVRLELQLRDLETSGILFRLEPEIDPVLQELVSRAGGEEQLRSQLDGIGAQWIDVDELALRVAAARCYVEQRLRPQISVRIEELQHAYETLVREELQPRGAPVPPFADLRDQIRLLLVEQKLNEEIERWTSQAEERLVVTRFAR